MMTEKQRYDLITDIQTRKAYASVTRHVDDALAEKMYDQLLKRVMDGQDRFEIVQWLNREWAKAGELKQTVIKQIYDFVEEKIP